MLRVNSNPLCILRLVKRTTLTILVLLALAYVGTWMAFGDRALLKRAVRMVWTDADLVRLNAAVPFAFCTDLTQRDTLTAYDRSARVLSMACFEDESLPEIQREADLSSLPEDQRGLIVGFAELRFPNPVLARNDIGLWYYGTDYYEQREEWVTWAFIGWLPLFGRDLGLGRLSPEEDA